MPSNFIKNVEKVCGISSSDVEKKWNSAKSIVKDYYPKIKEGSDQYWSLVTGITKKMLGKKCFYKLKQKKESEPSERLVEIFSALDELQVKLVVCGGKVVRKIQCPAGMKAQGGQCVRMTLAEQKSQHKTAVRTARKVRSKSKQIATERAKSMKK